MLSRSSVVSPVAMAARGGTHIRYSQFRGKQGEDPDAHVRQFDNLYTLNVPGPLEPLHKKAVFESTLHGKALRWLAEYPVGHFPSYDVIWASFLCRFWVEKMIAQTLECL